MKEDSLSKISKIRKDMEYFIKIWDRITDLGKKGIVKSFLKDIEDLESIIIIEKGGELKYGKKD